MSDLSTDQSLTSDALPANLQVRPVVGFLRARRVGVPTVRTLDALGLVENRIERPTVPTVVAIAVGELGVGVGDDKGGLGPRSQPTRSP